MGWALAVRRRARIFFCFLFLLVVALVLECQLRYPETITIFQGESLPTKSKSAYLLDLPAGQNGVLTESGELVPDGYNRFLSRETDGSFEMTVKLFGLVPVRSVTVDEKRARMLKR